MEKMERLSLFINGVETLRIANNEYFKGNDCCIEKTTKEEFKRMLDALDFVLDIKIDDFQKERETYKKMVEYVNNDQDDNNTINNDVQLVNEITNIKNDYKNSDTKINVDALCDYDDSSYISDAISEICDTHVDIYYYDLFEWAKYNFNYINDANNEYGLIDSDITKQIQQGQFYKNNLDCDEMLNDMIKIYCYNLFISNDIYSINQEEFKKLNDFIDDVDDNGYLPSYNDIKEELEKGDE